MDSNIYILQQGGGLIRETKLPMQKLQLKLQGGLCARGGCICGIVRYLSFPNLNNEQTHPHSESITSSQLVDSQHSTEPSS